MSLPRVSVIIPVHNGERFLTDALRSIFAQTFRSFEVLVIDEASTDASVDIALQFDVQVLPVEHPGVAAARNRGLELARGELVAFLDQHDRWTPDKLAVQVRQLDRHPDWEGVSSRVRMWIDAAGPADEQQPACLLGAMLLRKSVFDEVGRFDPLDRWTSESQWFARALARGATIVMTPQTLYEKRLHGTRDLPGHAPHGKRSALARQRPAA